MEKCARWFLAAVALRWIAAALGTIVFFRVQPYPTTKN
jgi:hypothetical protein